MDYVDPSYIKHFLRKQIAIISYLQIKKKQLPEAIARDTLSKKHSDRKTRNINKQKEAIEDLLDNEKRYHNTVEPILKQYHDADIIHISEKNIHQLS